MYGPSGGGGVEAVWEFEDPHGGAAGGGSGEAGMGNLRWGEEACYIRNGVGYGRTEKCFWDVCDLIDS